MVTKIYKSMQHFLNRKDRKTNGVSAEFALDNLDYKKANANNEGCWNCNECKRCKYCYDCYDCFSCLRCYSCTRIPYMEDCKNIHFG